MTDLAINFGSYVAASDVRDAVQSTIKLWSMTYLAEMARHDGQPAGAFPDFRSYPDSINASKFDEDQVPSCVLVVPGLTRPPVKRGDGKYSATWSVGVAPIVSGSTRDRTIRLAELYTLAVRLILLQKRSLGGFASATRWLGERFLEPGTIAQTRTIVCGLLQVEVDVDTAAQVMQGPVDPITDGSTPIGWPTVATAQMTVASYPSDEEIPTP